MELTQIASLGTKNVKVTCMMLTFFVPTGHSTNALATDHLVSKWVGWLLSRVFHTPVEFRLLPTPTEESGLHGSLVLRFLYGWLHKHNALPEEFIVTVSHRRG